MDNARRHRQCLMLMHSIKRQELLECIYAAGLQFQFQFQWGAQAETTGSWRECLFPVLFLHFTVKPSHALTGIINQKRSTTQTGQERCLCQVAKSIFDHMWSWPLTYCIQDVPTQWAFTVICARQVWLKSVWKFLRHHVKRDFCDSLQPHVSLIFDHQTAKLSFYAADPWTTCANCSKIGSFVFEISCSQVW